MKVKKDHWYWADGKSLGLSKGHSIIVLSKKGSKCRVRTLTSMEHEKDGRLRFSFKALNQAKNGDVLPIPKREINSPHYSGVYMGNIKTVDSSDIRPDYLRLKVPRLYLRLIHRR